MTIKECPNCPGATDHTAADCPIKPAWSVDTDGILRNAQGEWVAELVAWDKEKLAAMLEGEVPPQDSPNVEWPVSLMESALTGKPATGRCITCNCTTPCGKLFCEDHSYLAPVDQPSAAQSAPDEREAARAYRMGADVASVESGFIAGAAWQRAQSAPVVPEGWRLVPLEPTEEMIDAGCREHTCVQGDSWYSDSEISEHDAIAVFKAMLAAASKVAPHG